MSIFGSLGVVSAGFKTLVACFSFGNIEGAKILGNMGFEPQGENLSLIMVEGGKGKNRERYIIETRMDELIEKLNIDINRIIGVSHKSVAWNIKMMTTTALLCAFSITPYIFLNLVSISPNLGKSTSWLYPVLRSTGGFITATLIQLLIQRRITTLSDQYLVRRDQPRNRDEEADGDTKIYRMIARLIVPTWLLLCLLLIGLLTSVVGYVGCFSLVQGSSTTSGPVSWLCLEAGVSVVRLAIWGWNPMNDDAPPLEIILELDKYDPLPTCNKDNAGILEYKVLPLTRARDFLKIITSFAGLIKPFSNPDLSLYYTLTRKRPSVIWWNSGDVENAKKHILGERTLYITVFDHKERTTRVYTRDDEVDTFYSTKSNAPLVDVGHFILEVEIDTKINPEGDPVCSNNLNLLRKHHQSILENIHYQLGTTDVSKTYAIENNWTMKVDLENTISTLQRLRDENENHWKAVVETGKMKERNEKSPPICDYFMHSSIERERRLLDETRDKWIARRMEMIHKETKEGYEGEMGVEHRVNKQAVEKKPATQLEEVEKRLEEESYCMELLLVYEVDAWEQLFWDKFKAFLVQIGTDRVEEKERLTREWRTNRWKRLNPQMDASLKRMADFDNFFLDTVSKQWALTISQLFERIQKVNVDDRESYDLISPRLREWIQHLTDEMRLRIEKEIEDTEFRLKRGSDLGRFDQFWDDDSLFDCRYSRSKWLYLNQCSTVPLEIYSHALKGNKNIIHITFGLMGSGFDVNRFLCDLPWLTSISRTWDWLMIPVLLPAIHRDPLFIPFDNDFNDNDLNTFTKKIKLDPSTYIFSNTGNSAIFSRLGGKARILISFVAPTSGKSLTLRVKHSGGEDGPLEVALGSTKIQLNPSSKSSLTIDDMTLYPIQVPDPSESNHLEFEPEIRNDIFIQFIGTVEEHSHYLDDVVLLDEAGLEYMPYNGQYSASQASSSST